MKIYRKSGGDITITDPKKAELYFDITDNTLAVKTIDGQFNVKETSWWETYDLKQILKESEIDKFYKTKIAIEFDPTPEWFNDGYHTVTLSGANAYHLSDGTIYSDYNKNEVITHTWKDVNSNHNQWVIFGFNNEIITSQETFGLDLVAHPDPEMAYCKADLELFNFVIKDCIINRNSSENAMGQFKLEIPSPGWSPRKIIRN